MIENLSNYSIKWKILITKCEYKNISFLFIFMRPNFYFYKKALMIMTVTAKQTNNNNDNNKIENKFSN